MEALPEVTLTILFDNYNSNIDFRSSWGFSCLIEGTGRTILFDAGSKDGNLMHNFKAAGRNPCDVELIVLSHNHWDHTGGLQEFLDSRTGVDVFLPASFPDDIKDSISHKGANPVEVEGFGAISDHAWTTGEMGDKIIEQSLIIETSKGLVILTGCAHPGIGLIVEKAVKEKGDKILLAMGGFHLHKTDERSVRSISTDFYNQNIQYVAPTHCSGDSTRQIFKQVFANHFIQAGAGTIIRTTDLH